MINIFMGKVMDFQNWLFVEEQNPNQVDGILDEIANKFEIGGLDEADKEKYKISDLKLRTQIYDNNERMSSVKTSLEELGPIRNMSPEQKQKFNDMITNLSYETTLNVLAQKITAIISGEQKKI
jgi:hypothetical protein